MTEGPYKLPEGWRWVRLGEVFELQQGASMSPKRRAGHNPKPFLRTKNVLWGSIDLSSVDEMDFTQEEVEKLRLMPGDLLVCEGGEVGRTAIWEGHLPLMLYQNHIHRLRAKNNDIEPRFFMYWMQAAYQVFRAYVGAESRTAIPNLSGRRLKAFLAPLPPLDEQRRIVARVKELMSRVREAKRLRQQAKEDAERLMQAALAEVFPRPGAELPTGWRWVRLGEVCDVIMGQSPPSRTYNLEGDGLPFYQGKADFGELFPTPRVWCSAPQKIAHPGEILISVRAPVGPTNLADRECCIGRGLAALRPKDALDRFWLMFYLKSIEAELTTRGAGSTFTAITKKDLESLSLPLPPLDEQRRIVAHLEAVQEKVKALKEAQAATDAELQRLEQAILDKAFRGEL